ncbi:MAG: lipid-binding SYLF domain-containing protein [Pseudomonadota bacterium]|nr:lipid-binding SYLF domain-containing protein [Pseudomonadota bacterium]
MHKLRLLQFIAVLAFSSFTIVGPGKAQDPQKLVEDSAALAKSLLADPVWAIYKEQFRRAKGVVLAPDILKAGLLVGGGGGQCLVLARKTSAVNGWSAPSFCGIGEASIGLQIGIQKLEVMLLVMNEEALRHIASGTAILGGEAGMSVGLIGSSIESSTTLNLDYDIVAFARGKGFYGGVVLDGGYIGPDKTYNKAYYGRDITARQILFADTSDSGRASALQAALSVE